MNKENKKWHRAYAGDEQCIVDSSNSIIAFIKKTDYEKSIGQLIAAAPDMLEVIEDTILELEFLHEAHLNMIISKLKNVQNKAQGGKP